MKAENITTVLAASNIVNWLLGIVFVITGVLNVLLVHPVPGVFYILLSFTYFPFADSMFKKIFGCPLPPLIKIVIGLVILWGTLGVGDLAEIIGL